MPLNLMNITRIFKYSLCFVAVYTSLLFFFSGFIFNFDKYFIVDDSNISFQNELPSNWISSNKVGKKLKNTIVISEDWLFYTHIGLDFKQIYIAVRDYLSGKKKLRGASTISQQVVKNLFLNRKKTYFRKFNELILTLFLELFLSKERILEKYLNLIELGKNIYGVKKGSWYYFKKHPSQLNYRESAFIAMLLPSPLRYSKSFHQQELTEYANNQVSKILDKILLAKLIDESSFHELSNQKFDWEN